MPYAPNTVEIVVAFASRSAAARDHSLSSNEQSTLKHKGATAEAKPLWSTELCASCALLPHNKPSHSAHSRQRGVVGVPQGNPRRQYGG